MALKALIGACQECASGSLPGTNSGECWPNFSRSSGSLWAASIAKALASSPSLKPLTSTSTTTSGGASGSICGTSVTSFTLTLAASMPFALAMLASMSFISSACCPLCFCISPNLMLKGTMCGSAGGSAGDSTGVAGSGLLPASTSVLVSSTGAVAGAATSALAGDFAAAGGTFLPLRRSAFSCSSAASRSRMSAVSSSCSGALTTPAGCTIWSLMSAINSATWSLRSWICWSRSSDLVLRRGASSSITAGGTSSSSESSSILPARSVEAVRFSSASSGDLIGVTSSLASCSAAGAGAGAGSGNGAAAAGAAMARAASASFAARARSASARAVAFSTSKRAT
mmetsp:Transcript_5254/g.8953  ORF Transcript_5254/g.8953 Transcript_5254/m.8953 type:complete len:342 (-) Transcript_5254:25-1050(-)